MTTARFIRFGPGAERAAQAGGAELQASGERVGQLGGGAVVPARCRVDEGLELASGCPGRGRRPASRERGRPAVRGPPSHPLQDLREQRAHARGGRVARREHLLVVERLPGDPGSGVRHEGQPQDLQARLPRRDRLQRGRHAHEVRAEHACHPDLGGSLVLRAGELRVDALLQRRLDLAAERTQPGGVQVGEVDERRARAAGRRQSG